MAKTLISYKERMEAWRAANRLLTDSLWTPLDGALLIDERTVRKYLEGQPDSCERYIWQGQTSNNLEFRKRCIHVQILNTLDRALTVYESLKIRAEKVERERADAISASVT